MTSLSVCLSRLVVKSLAPLGLLVSLTAGHSVARTPPNLLVDSLTGDVMTSALTFSDYNLTADATTLTIKRGQSGTVGLTVTPFGNYKGAIGLSCGPLPANLNCLSSNVTPTLDGTGSPVTLKLTVATNGFVADLRPGPLGGSRVVSASLLLLPAGLGALLLAFGRKSIRHRSRVLLLTFIVSAGLTGLLACGSGVADAAAGTTAITVTGSGAVSHTLNLAVTVQ